MDIRGKHVMKRGVTMAFSPQRLRKLRRLRDLTQTELGVAIGGTQRMISSYETGKDLPRADVLANICKALGVSADYLLELSDVVENVKLSGKEWAIIYDLRTGNPHALNDAMSNAMLHGGSRD